MKMVIHMRWLFVLFKFRINSKQNIGTTAIQKAVIDKGFLCTLLQIF
jgi:hypothetical protein